MSEISHPETQEETIDDLRNLSDSDNTTTVEDSLDSLRDLAEDTTNKAEVVMPDEEAIAKVSSPVAEVVIPEKKTEAVAVASPSEVVMPEKVDLQESSAKTEVVMPEPKTEVAVETPTSEKAVQPVTEKPKPASVASSPAPEPKFTGKDSYNPSFALKIFTICRYGFIALFDVILTGVAIVLEHLALIDWAGIASRIGSIFSKAHAMVQTRLPRKVWISAYALTVILLLGIPISVGAFSLFSGTDATLQNNPSQVSLISQDSNSIVDNGILAPLFTPTVQYWAEDIARWTVNTNITPDMLAVVMQLESCGNPTVEGGLFGIADSNSAYNDPETEAQLALARLQNALTLGNDDFGLALAIYADGESVLQSDFVAWSFHARDMFILGRNFYYQAQQGMTTSPDLTSWMQNTGAGLCTQAQTTLNS